MPRKHRIDEDLVNISGFRITRNYIEGSDLGRFGMWHWQQRYLNGHLESNAGGHIYREDLNRLWKCIGSRRTWTLSDGVSVVLKDVSHVSLVHRGSDCFPARIMAISEEDFSKLFTALDQLYEWVDPMPEWVIEAREYMRSLRRPP